MDYQGKYNNKTVAAFLINDVHPAMEVKYYANKNVKEANELQQFFQDLKNTAKARAKNNMISNVIMDQLLNSLEELGKQR